MRLIKHLTKPTHFTAVGFGHLVIFFKTDLHCISLIFYLSVTFRSESSRPSTLEAQRRTPQLDQTPLACRNLTGISHEATKFQCSDKFVFTHDTDAKRAFRNTFPKPVFSIMTFIDSNFVLL